MKEVVVSQETVQYYISTSAIKHLLKVAYIKGVRKVPKKLQQEPIKIEEFSQVISKYFVEGLKRQDNSKRIFTIVHYKDKRHLVRDVISENRIEEEVKKRVIREIEKEIKNPLNTCMVAADSTLRRISEPTISVKNYINYAESKEIVEVLNIVSDRVVELAEPIILTLTAELEVSHKTQKLVKRNISTSNYMLLLLISILFMVYHIYVFYTLFRTSIIN